MGAGGERSIRQVAAKGYNLLLGQYPPQRMLASSRTQSKRAAAASIPCKWGCRAPFSLPTGETRKSSRWNGVCRTTRVSCAWQRSRTARCLAGRTAPSVIRTRSTYGAPCTAVPKRLRSSSRFYARSVPVTSSLTGVAQAVAPGGRESLRRFARSDAEFRSLCAASRDRCDGVIAPDCRPIPARC